MASRSRGVGNVFTSTGIITNDYNNKKYTINLKMPANVTISAKVSRAEKDALTSLSKTLGVSQSTLIRLAIKKLIIEYYRSCRGEIRERISVLAEILEKTIESEVSLCND